MGDTFGDVRVHTGPKAAQVYADIAKCQNNGMYSDCTDYEADIPGYTVSHSNTRT